MSVENPRNSTLVTAFGQFKHHTKNVSQQVLEILKEDNTLSSLDEDMDFIFKVLDVEYSMVNSYLQENWTKCCPKLMIHMGVSDIASEITIETQSFNTGYNNLDNKTCTPESEICVPGAPSLIRSTLDFPSIIEEAKQSQKLDIGFTLSSDPGRFLCGYSYFLSLSKDSSRAVFIHVPILRKVSEDPQLALKIITDAVRAFVCALYRHVSQRDECGNSVT